MKRLFIILKDRGSLCTMPCAIVSTLNFRDTFYELLREWQEKHLTAGWSMADAQGARIAMLLSQSVHLTNLIHFSRLFQSQLMQVWVLNVRCCVSINSVCFFPDV
jgi:hypothetical protein